MHYVLRWVILARRDLWSCVEFSLRIELFTFCMTKCGKPLGGNLFTGVDSTTMFIKVKLFANLKKDNLLKCSKRNMKRKRVRLRWVTMLNGNSTSRTQRTWVRVSLAR